MEQTADTKELEVQTQAPEESQTLETVTNDVVTEEEINVEEPVVEEAKSESEPAPVQEEPKKVEEENIPFTERPGVRERLDEIEEKYGSKATYWDTIAEVSQQDPEFRFMVLEKLEATGKLPKGTAESFKKKTEVQTEKTEYINNLPEDIRADLEAARQIRTEREQQKLQEVAAAEKYFADFEQSRPEIGKSPNPPRTRNLIFTLASELVERDGMEFDGAMEQAYQVVVRGSKTQNEQLERQIQENQENASAIAPSVSNASGKMRRLSQEEKRAAELAGMSIEEYVKYRDSSEDDIFESL